MNEVLLSVRKNLKEQSDEGVRKSAQQFFKEAIKSYGVTMPKVQKIAQSCFREINTLPKNEIFNLCTQLWQSGYQEEAIVACHWSYSVRKQYEQDDFGVFKSWINQYVSNWASCDTLCNHTVGAFLEMFPSYIGELKSFASSTNRWMKRASAVSLIIPARKGMFLQEIFQIADTLLIDEDDLVQKGYGWMLKAASEADQQAVFEFVLRNKSLMPRTALRYSIEKMSPEMRREAMSRQS
ncbi:DNA alkylation repair protein [Pararcticibacter amylolyticus]|uniref:DNA alkylation repair protein n=1 Tax=Pararcticibacter amylolyticus TaxID=2173175 RepID=A0A2U2PC92_9SPHI|nr:DNA alkylation repair protein [Pararcticibacter amylolyticus]PWG78914.1 DNA alkylation repair protein [Pararcticibacter amylolyticus]